MRCKNCGRGIRLIENPKYIGIEYTHTDGPHRMYRCDGEVTKRGRRKDKLYAEPLTPNDIFKLIKKEWQENPE